MDLGAVETSIHHRPIALVHLCGGQVRVVAVAAMMWQARQGVGVVTDSAFLLGCPMYGELELVSKHASRFLNSIRSQTLNNMHPSVPLALVESELDGRDSFTCTLGPPGSDPMLVAMPRARLRALDAISVLRVS